MPSEDSASAPEAHDLSQTVGKYLDRHMMLPLLDFLATKKVYPESELDAARLQILSRTNMVDFAMDIYKKVNPGQPVPTEMSSKRDEVMATMQTLRDEASPVLTLLADTALVSTLRSDRYFTLPYLQENHGVTPAHVAALGKHAKFTFDCGDYATAVGLLSSFRLLTPNADEAFSAQWGKLACEILLGSWDVALEDLGALKDAIESRSASSTPAMLLQQRAWLMHWSLFLFGNHASGRQLVGDLLLSDRYLNAIQTCCPHLLRYAAVAVVTNPRRRHLVKELVRAIAMERPVYSDPVTLFLDNLYSAADFDQAQTGLDACAAAIEADFFLSAAAPDFVSHARLHIFESYCRIHERIDLTSLAAKLGMQRLAAEKWIVTMVADAQLNARIDGQSGQVILGVHPPDIYQQVIEKTKGLSFRSYVLAQNLQHKEMQAQAAKGEVH